MAKATRASLHQIDALNARPISPQVMQLQTTGTTITPNHPPELFEPADDDDQRSLFHCPAEEVVQGGDANCDHHGPLSHHRPHMAPHKELPGLVACNDNEFILTILDWWSWCG